MSNITNLQSALERLNVALRHIEDASGDLQDACRSLDATSFNYNITGNMEAYVINYLTEGHDSIRDKIEKYIQEVEEQIEDERAMEDEEEEELEEEENVH